MEETTALAPSILAAMRSSDVSHEISLGVAGSDLRQWWKLMSLSPPLIGELEHGTWHEVRRVGHQSVGSRAAFSPYRLTEARRRRTHGPIGLPTFLIATLSQHTLPSSSTAVGPRVAVYSLVAGGRLEMIPGSMKEKLRYSGIHNSQAISSARAMSRVGIRETELARGHARDRTRNDTSDRATEHATERATKLATEHVHRPSGDPDT